MSSPQRAKARVPFLLQIVIAIALGIGTGNFLPEWFIRAILTFNSVYWNFLSFLIPIIILGLVAPAIADLGVGAGKWLGITAAIAYGSTLFSGFLVLFTGLAVYPTILATKTDVSQITDPSESLLSGYITVDMPPVFGVMTALVLAFVLGIGMSFIKGNILHQGLSELREIIFRIIQRAIVPLLPIYIFGSFLNLTASGQAAIVISAFAKVIVFLTILMVILIILQYSVAGLIAKRNPFEMIKTMLPAFFTALGTSSSAATIPVTVKQTIANKVSESVADFVIPLCATIHLAGSTLKIVGFSMAVFIISGDSIDVSNYIVFIFMLGVTMVAAPGVPGGAIVAAAGILQSLLNFSPDQVSIMIATYVAIDSIGTATNVIGDGAIAVIIDKLSGGSLQTSTPDSDELAGEAA